MAPKTDLRQSYQPNPSGISLRPTMKMSSLPGGSCSCSLLMFSLPMNTANAMPFCGAVHGEAEGAAESATQLPIQSNRAHALSHDALPYDERCIGCPPLDRLRCAAELVRGAAGVEGRSPPLLSRCPASKGRAQTARLRLRQTRSPHGEWREFSYVTVNC